MSLASDSVKEPEALKTPEMDLSEPWQVISVALQDAFDDIKQKRPFTFTKSAIINEEQLNFPDMAVDDQKDVEMLTMPPLDRSPTRSSEPVYKTIEEALENPIESADLSHEQPMADEIIPLYITQHTTAWPLITVINELDENVEPAIEYSNELRFHKHTSVPSSQYPGCPCEEGGSYKKDGTMLSTMSSNIHECNSWCGCPGDCPNRVTQQPRSIPLMVERVCKDDVMAWAVKAQKFILEGTYIDQYVGEVITTRIATKRSMKYTLEEETMVLDMRLGSNYDSPIFAIDPVVYGNVTRFFRHSENPNTKIVAIYSESSDLHFHRLAFFSIKDIEAGEELTFTNWNKD
ncbi:hypothetical protein INT43_005719 [Umbelopsis isabellina]|uniref:SET domain-containing protein n=1 Tax=Mortierella isabellina TaxID=91625 RepID=A0A8H7PN67_MORIS|nr:hypothetical protein INT43_005719 [Umbelopsis isabellina]